MPREFVYGIQPVLQVLECRRRAFFKLFLHRSHLSKEMKQVLRLAEKNSLPIQETDRHRLFELSKNTHHQGVVLESEEYPYEDFDKKLNDFKNLDGNSTILVLDQVQDPQNLGAILRSAQCVGIQAVLLPEKGSGGVAPPVLKASAGGAESLCVCPVKNLPRALKSLKDLSYWIYGGEAGGHPYYFDTPFREKPGLILGGERAGVAH